MHRVTIELTDEQHRQLCDVAASRGKTIGAYVVERLFSMHTDSDQHAWEEAKALLGDRIARADANQVLARTSSEIAADRLRALTDDVPCQTESAGEFVRRMRDEDRY